MKICSDKVKQILDDKTSPLYPILDKNGIMDIIENPQNISSPWYGQLMKAPQIMAYIIEIEYWLKEYGVVIEC